VDTDRFRVRFGDTRTEREGTMGVLTVVYIDASAGYSISSHLNLQIKKKYHFTSELTQLPTYPLMTFRFFKLSCTEIG
jgi:hypothetical protein